jgi:hypothetical protein
VLVLALLPHFVPLLAGDQLYDWGWLYADLPVAIATLLAVSLGIRRLPSASEQHVWGLVATAYGVALVIEFGNAFISDAISPSAVDLLLTSGCLAFYLAVTLAAMVMSPGGRVSLGSTEGLGTRVVVHIPVARGRPARVETGARPRRGRARSSSWTTRHRSRP